MAKQVKVRRLALTNFKGLRNVAVDFTGDVTTISGANGTGKTTIVDAFNWLLWGKDSEGNSDQKFGIKTNDKNGAFIPHLDHEVTGTFEVTDTETGETENRIFRRVLVEDWKETLDEVTGETSEYLKGHHTNYYYNEMPLKTKAEYDRLVADMIPEAVFKVITNPSYFLTQHWQDQRNMLLEMAGSITDAEIAGTDPKFSKLLELLQGKTLEGYQAKIKEDRAKIEADLQRIPTRIDEVTRNTPAAIDFAALEAQLTQLKEAYDEAETAMTSAAEANRQAYTVKQGIQETINDFRLKQQNILFKAQQEAAAANREKNRAYDEAEQDIREAQVREQSENRTFESESRRLKAAKQRAAELEQQHTKEQDRTREEWFNENAKEFDTGERLICPLFKHGCADSNALSAWNDNQAAARENFDAEKQTRLAEITKRGQQLGQQIKQDMDDQQQAQAELDELTKTHEATLTALRDKVEKAQATMKANPKQEATKQVTGADLPEWVHLQEEIVKLTEKLQAEQQPEDNTAQFRQKRNELQAQMDAVKADLAKREQIQQAEDRIKELNEQKKALQKDKAQLQKKEDLVAEFEKARMDEVERRVNAMFQYVEFRMYRQQIEDAKQVPDCVAYIEGTRYADKNNAGQINAGLDVINTLCSFYKVSAPIFIDNAESVNDFIPVGSQLIKLVVTTGTFAVKNL